MACRAIEGSRSTGRLSRRLCTGTADLAWRSCIGTLRSSRRIALAGDAEDREQRFSAAADREHSHVVRRAAFHFATAARSGNHRLGISNVVDRGGALASGAVLKPRPAAFWSASTRVRACARCIRVLRTPAAGASCSNPRVPTHMPRRSDLSVSPPLRRASAQQEFTVRPSSSFGIVYLCLASGLTRNVAGNPTRPFDAAKGSRARRTAPAWTRYNSNH